MARPPGKRCDWLICFFVFLFLALIAQMFRLQVLQADYYRGKATNQRVQRVKKLGVRGSILDRQGSLLATSSRRYNVNALPYRIKEKDRLKVATSVAVTLRLPVPLVLEKISRSASNVLVAKELAPSRVTELQNHPIDGIWLEEAYRRIYPSGNLGAKVIGILSREGKGVAGMEQQYDELLRGRDGVSLIEMDASKRPYPDGVNVVEEKRVDGRNLVLTIDAPLQAVTDDVLRQTVKKFKAKGGCIVAMDPGNGAILALSGYPDFNPNITKGLTNDSLYNPAVWTAFEPGSTFKPITVVSAVDEGLVTPQTVIGLPATLRIGERTIHEAHRTAAVAWNVEQILARSSNIGAVKIGQMLGKRRLAKHVLALGFGARTGIDFPCESYGRVRPKDWFIGNIPMGQGLSMTAMQLVRAYAAIANGGRLVTPHLGQLIQTPEKTGYAVKKLPADRAVLSPAACKKVRDMLKATITRGTGAAAGLDDYVVCGKTGTAQKPGRGGYAKGKYIASFIGMVPADEPRAVILVVIDEPTPIWGSVVAAPAFRDVAGFAMERQNAKPEPEKVRALAKAQTGNVRD